MDYLARYKVPFKGLKDGIHEFEFSISKDFFEYFKEAGEYSGELKAEIVLEKKSLVMPLKLRIEGVVSVACDRCLERFDMPVSGETSLFVKFGQAREELAEDVIVLPEEAGELNLSQYIYELFKLSLPLRVVHPLDEEGNSTCNKEMVRKIDELSVKEETPHDPRWNKLKKLLDNN